VELLEAKKLTYKEQIIGNDENWDYLTEYSYFFEKGFDSINYNTPAIIVISKIPFCSTFKCLKPENTKNKVISIGRKNSNSKPCIAGMRPVSFDSLFGEGILHAKKYSNVTKERVLKNPQKIAFEEGVMFKSIFLVIERYPEFKKYFEINDKKVIDFVDVLINGIRELQTQDIKAEGIREIKKNNKNNEEPFRDWFKTYLSGIYYSVNAEPVKGNGRIDLKIQDESIGTKIIEFKGWWNKDKNMLPKQIMGYLTDFEDEGFIILINNCKTKNVDKQYLKLIKSKEMGFKSIKEKVYKGTSYKYYITNHFDTIRTKSLYHLILNIF